MGKARLSKWLFGGAAALLLAGMAGSIIGQSVSPLEFAESLNILLKSGQLPVRADLVRGLRVPPGFRVNIFASPGGNTRMMAVLSDGTVYVTRQREGDVLSLRDMDGDGGAEEVAVVASGLELVHGVAAYGDMLYLVSPKIVWRTEIRRDRSLETPQILISDLPDGGQHRARTIAVGPDQRLYISVGSTCNACDETNKQNATIQRAELDGSRRATFASGLRHTIGFDWHPLTGELWGWDNGSDSRGNDTPREELNRIVESANYGWPFCFEHRRVDRLLATAPERMTREAYCAATAGPESTYTAHSAPIGFTFYNASQFPGEYRGDAFLALHGSWNRFPVSGYKVVRVRFQGDKPVSVEDFLDGFQFSTRREGFTNEAGPNFFGRPAGVAVHQDGSLLVADDGNGIIYRVVYDGSLPGRRP